MRLLSWLLCAAAAIVPVITSEEKSIARPKRESSDKKIVCYYTNWSVYRPGTAKFTPQNINPYLCTHLIYAFGGLSKDNALKPFDKYQDIEQGGYAKFNGLKTYNKNLKTMLAIGGWNEGSARFSPLVADAERRRELVKNTVKFLRQNHFDGLDLDWEYPSFRDGGKPRDRDNYATLVQEFREEFEKESEKTGRPRLLLTMAVPAGIEYIDKGYDVPKLNKYLDWMNILSYDYHSAFEPAINHHSPLFSMEEEDEYNFDAQLNIDYTVQHYIKLGADRNKLVLGIPTYGRSYTLFNPDATDIGSPADGPGEQGEATREKGYLAYYEICERVKSGGWSIENPNPEAMGPYAYKDNQWVGYDDEDIARAKAKYVNDNDLGGIMFWSIDNDDFRGKCHGKPYPLIEAAKEALLASANELAPSTRTASSRSSLKKQEEEQSPKSKPRKTRLRTKSSTTTEASKAKSSGRTTTTPQPPTTPDPGSDFVCKDEGFFPHPRDCKKYFWCLDSGPSSLGIVAHQFTCPSGLVFNKISDSCDYPRNVICKTKTEQASTTTTTTTTSTTTQRTTTARSRLVITASPPRTTTTTTTEPPEEEEESEEDEEDPGTIKELINLIKKLGGVEQLEKQLNIQNSDEKEKIKPSLYSKVLQGRTANRYRGLNDESSTTKYVSAFRNRPVEPQSPSTDVTSTRGQDKPRYVTIQRNRPTKRPSRVEEESEEEEEEEEEEEVIQEQPKRKSESPRPFRRRPNGDTTTEKEYVVLRRSRPKKEEDISTPKYKNIVRVRSTTEAPAEEEEEEEDEDVVSEEQPQEEEEEGEEEKEEVESGQKLKKYSSIIRDGKKVVSDEEETKVSGPQGPQYTSGVSSPTTDHTLDGRDSVNNVNTVTSPRYVEIRRTQSTTTEPSEVSVNNVNTSHDRENKQVQNETNEVTENEPETKENDKNDFQRRFTTEIVKRPTRPSITSLILERTTPFTAEPSYKESFRGRFRSAATTESISTTEIKPNIRYRTINRNNLEKSLSTDRDKPYPSSVTEQFFRGSTATESSPTPVVSRRFQFAPRTKPTILSPKPSESTTEAFTITVPDLPNSVYTDNGLGTSSNSPSFPPGVTLEPVTPTPPTIVDSTHLDVPENEVVLTTFAQKTYPTSTRHVIPTTSTQTSVVTSITESSFTERIRIYVPKKARFKFSEVTTEPIVETTKPLLRSFGYKSISRTTTPKVETTTEARRRRFKGKSTTTTTTTEEPEKKYVPKKTRNFKKITSTEAPEVTSSNPERTRFFPRNRQTGQSSVEPSNSLYVRLGNARRKKVVTPKDDLDADQTSTFVGDGTDRYIVGGSVKQKSDKDFLNADIFLITVPTVGGEQKSPEKAEDLINSVELTKTTVPASNKSVVGSTRESVRSRFITSNPNLRNLRTRTRNLNEPTEKPNSTESSRPTNPARGTFRNNFYTSNPNLNFRTQRTRAQSLTGFDKKEEPADSAVQEAHTKEIFKSRFTTPGTKANFKLLQNSDFFGNSKERIEEENNSDEKSYSSNQNLQNLKTLRGRSRFQKVNENSKEILSNQVEEVNEEESIKDNLLTPNFRQGRTRTRQPGKVTESTTSSTVGSSTQERNFRNLRARTRPFNTNTSQVTEATVGSTGTKEPTSRFTSNPSQAIFRTRTGDNNTEAVTIGSTFVVVDTREPILDNFIVVDSGQSLTTGTHSSTTTGSTVSPTTTAIDSTFGTKIVSTLGSTISSTGSTVAPTVGSSSGSTVTSTSGFNSFTRSTKESTRSTFLTGNPSKASLIASRAKSRFNVSEIVTEPTSSTIPIEPVVNNIVLSNPSSSSFRKFRTRTRQNATEEQEEPVVNNIIPSSPKALNFRVLRLRTRGKENGTEDEALGRQSLNETGESDRNGRPTFPKDRRRVLAKVRQNQSTVEAKEKEDETVETPEAPSPTTSKTVAKQRGNQEYFTNLRSRARSATQTSTTSERPERRRSQLVRGRYRGDTKLTTSKPETQTETSSRSNNFLRRRIRPTTSTTTTTEEPYIEQQEDSRLEESKALDETPDIQDLADPAVVAIHNLATVSPGPPAPVGPGVSGGTTPLKFYSETPATYTVHVTPADIASFTTPARISTVTPGTVSSRPTSILTLKPYTVPVITQQYIKQTPVPIRTPSPFRGAGIAAVSTEEPYSSRSEILIQSRRQETTPRPKPTISVSSSTSQKVTSVKTKRVKPFSKVPKQEAVQSVNSPEPPVDYEYYDDDDDPLANIPASALKVKVHSDGYIECLDRGNFPHPFSCKKFISCAKMENNELLGWEYTCPKHLSFDPVGGICNWSAGLGCQH